MACCKNDLGSFPHNRIINTGVQAEQSGIHELRFTGANFNTFSKFLTFTEDDVIVIPQGLLNEDFQYSLVIVQPDGSLLEVDSCETFTFRTFINKVDCDDIGYL